MLCSFIRCFLQGKRSHFILCGETGWVFTVRTSRDVLRPQGCLSQSDPTLPLLEVWTKNLWLQAKQCSPRSQMWLHDLRTHAFLNFPSVWEASQGFKTNPCFPSTASGALHEAKETCPVACLRTPTCESSTPSNSSDIRKHWAESLHGELTLAPPWSEASRSKSPQTSLSVWNVKIPFLEKWKTSPNVSQCIIYLYKWTKKGEYWILASVFFPFSFGYEFLIHKAFHRC